MTQIHVPVKVTTKQTESLNTAIAKELSFEDNKDLFLHFINGKVAESGKH